MNDQTPAGYLTAPSPIPMIVLDDGIAPAAPTDLRDTDVDTSVLADLVLKAAYSVPQFNTEWASRRIHLPQALVGELLEGLRGDHLLDILGEAGPFGFRYAISNRGRERASRLMEISGYVGPAPVSLAAYTAMLEWQMKRLPMLTPDRVESAISGLVLPERTVEMAGLAISSGRSLFLHGPPGNGKTSLGRALHQALEGDLWIPHCIGIDSTIIRVFDPQCHEATDEPTQAAWPIDRRWVRVRRPHIVVGGEMTMDSFDLTYSPALRYYEAPLHMKANGGTYLIDDFGRQRVDPHELLNRWIIPLEHRIDYLTLHTGQKIQVPFSLMLIVATNLDPGDVTDPAFLRRMGYRLHLGPPTPALYARIFQ
jgi:predicted ATPase with chaperone activity